MEYRILKYFLAVAYEENITRASEILHISQPALSRQLMQLEEELGVKLFIRGQRSITLTEEGHLLRRRAQEIIDLTEKTENEFKKSEISLGGVISIGLGEAETTRRIAEMMKGFSALYPNVKFELYSNNADYVKERLEKGVLDIGILIEPFDVLKYEYIRLPEKERWGVIVSADCPLAKKEALTAEDLKGYRVFTSKRGFTEGVVSWFGDEYATLDIYVTYNLIYNAAMLVDCGLGVALAIEGAVSLYQNPNIIFKPLSPEYTVSSVLVWKKHQPMSQAVSRFIDYLKCNLVMTCDKK